MTAEQAAISISIVIPLYNEEKVLPLLWERLLSNLKAIDLRTYQIIFVDDGSSDATWSILSSLRERDENILCLRLSRNFGQQAAYIAGLAEASNEAIILMDGDLQDDPALIPELLAQYRQGFEIVNVVRGDRNSPWWLRIAYRSFYRMLRWSSEYNMPLDSGDFSLISKRAAALIIACQERRPYIRGLRAWIGFRQTRLEASRPARAAGTSKYTLGKLLRLASDAFFSFSFVPLRFMYVVGAGAVFLSVIYGAFALYRKLFWHDSPSGFTALLLVIVFLGGSNFFAIGILGEYIGRILEEVRQRPRYIVDERLPNKSN